MREMSDYQWEMMNRMSLTEEMHRKRKEMEKAIMANEFEGGACYRMYKMATDAIMYEKKREWGICIYTMMLLVEEAGYGHRNKVRGVISEKCRFDDTYLKKLKLINELNNEYTGYKFFIDEEENVCCDFDLSDDVSMEKMVIAGNIMEFEFTKSIIYKVWDILK